MFNAKSRAGSNYLSIGFHKGGKFKGFLFSFAPTLLLLVDFPKRHWLDIINRNIWPIVFRCYFYLV